MRINRLIQRIASRTQDRRNGKYAKRLKGSLDRPRFPHAGRPRCPPIVVESQRFLVLPVRIELTTSPLPRGCSTTELRQRSSGLGRPKHGRKRRDPCHKGGGGASTRPIRRSAPNAPSPPCRRSADPRASAAPS